MKPFILEDRTFGLSGEPSQLEYYKCYHDPALANLITGEELLKLEETPDWNDDKASIWHYFYRPHNRINCIGPVQKKNIQKLDQKIKEGEEAKFLNKILLILLLIISLVSVYPMMQQGVIYLLVFIGIFACYLLIQRANLNGLLNENLKLRRCYQREIDFLMDQKQSIEEDRLTAREIEGLFWTSIRNSEDTYISRTFGDISQEVRDGFPDFYSNQLLEDYDHFDFPSFPVIPSWALLQSSKRNNAGSTQITGLQIIADELKTFNPTSGPDGLTGSEKIASWRRVSKGRALFRVWYIQFLIFHDDNLELVSYYYDFVRSKVYSQKIEAYQYKHITDYTYGDEDISYMLHDPLIKGLRIPATLTDNIFGNQVKTISLKSASGSSYRCVIPDNDVSNGIDLWLKSKHDQEAAIEGLGESTDSEVEYWANELLVIGKNYDGLIETLAWLSFKSIRERASKALKTSLEDTTPA